MIKRDEFMRYVNQDDFALRDAADVEYCYLADWFYERDGDRFFNLPTFYLRGQQAYFINGRHRTIVLARHLGRLPMALTQIDRESGSTLKSIADRSIDHGEAIFLPDLPIVGIIDVI